MQLRNDIERELDKLEMFSFNRGFEAALDGLDEQSNLAHNKGNPALGEALRWAVKELKGENIS